MKKLKKIPLGIAVGLVRFYRMAISPLFPACCRYIPTCSEYSLISFQRFGFRRGLLLTLKRLARCRPGGSYGFDPVPETWEEVLEKKRQRIAATSQPVAAAGNRKE